MAAFFSGTDIATLSEEGSERNHFVSLIVNNAGSYVAAITRKIKSKKVISDHFSYKSFDGQEINGSKDYEIEEESFEWYDLAIEFEDDIFNSIKERTNFLRLSKITNKRKEEKEKVVYVSPKPISGTYSSPEPKSYNTPSKSELPFDFDYIDNKIGKNDFEYILKHNSFDKLKAKELVLQLITGSIIISNASKIDMKKWAENMPNMYKKRFGDDYKGFKVFKDWADYYIDFLCIASTDEQLAKKGFDQDIIAILCAKAILEELSKLPQNKYIDYFIQILKDYTN